MHSLSTSPGALLDVVNLLYAYSYGASTSSSERVPEKPPNNLPQHLIKQNIWAGSTRSQNNVKPDYHPDFQLVANPPSPALFFVSSAR